MKVGDTLLPAAPHVEDGCRICRLRADGIVPTVRDLRAMALAASGPQAEKILRGLEGLHPDTPLDPPSSRPEVYVTHDMGYARFYAARSRGDLYRVAPVGDLTRSDEDHFESFTCGSAVVVAVIQRSIMLDRSERRAMERRWRKADRKHEARA